MKTYFKFSEKTKKILNYFSIFTIAIGSIFGTMNAAYALSFQTLDAADSSNDGAATTVIQTGAVIDMDETGTLTITSANGAETATDVGAITRSAGNPTVKIQTLAADTDDESLSIASITFAVANEGDIEVTNETDNANDGDFAVTIGDMSTLGKFEIDGNDASGNNSTVTVNLTGTTAVTEASTAVTAAKTLINLNISGASTTFTGGYAMDAVTGSVTLTMSGSAAQTFTGAVTVADDADGKIDITNTAGTTFASLVGAAGANRVGEVDINANAIATFSNLVATDLLEVVGSVTLAENNNDALDFNLGASSKLIIGKTVVAGETLITDVANASPTVTSGAKLYAPINLKTGTAIILTDGSDGAGDDATMIAALTTAAVDSVIMDYTVTIDDGNDQSDLNATAKTIATTESEAGITKNDATALHQAFLAAINDSVADDGAEEAFEDALLNSAGTYTAAEDTNLARQVAPQTDLISGSTFATKAMTGSLQSVMSNRMAALRSGDAYASGMSAGSLGANSGFLQVFGTDSEQKSKTVGSGTQAGYDASSAGVAIGFDGIADNGSVVGLSISMTQTDVDGKGTGKASNDIDSYTASIYVDNSSDAGYFEGSLTVGLNENNSSRMVNTGGLDRTYKGDYDSEQVSLKIGGGVPNAVGAGYVTPFGSVTATKISTDAYTETSSTASDALRLRVSQADVDSTVGTLGLKYHAVLDDGGIPMISLALNNEFGDKTINSTNTYQGGGSAFTTSTDVEELSATLGLGYSFSSDMSSVEFAYEVDANDDDYLSHYGSLKVVGKF
tara:strand:- start:137 stop:2515 length:2379 start_codon:yes stop_codon:yes gene_type:complete